ncbi:hypothetical protein M0802_007702 [Mischocyttarus mexicanus]|nr:hypothetical protein M0802_007702 [Mischocyttarus mexicanus]
MRGLNSQVPRIIPENSGRSSSPKRGHSEIIRQLRNVKSSNTSTNTLPPTHQTKPTPAPASSAQRVLETFPSNTPINLKSL